MELNTDTKRKYNHLPAVPNDQGDEQLENEPTAQMNIWPRDSNVTMDLSPACVA